MSEDFHMLIVAAGLWYVIGASKIFGKARDAIHATGIPALRFIIELIECPGCFGVWIGLLTALIWGYGIPVGDLPLPITTALAFAASNMIIAKLMGWTKVD